MVRMDLRHGLSRSLSLIAASLALAASCDSSSADCITNVDGSVSCTGYADAYPYDYAYAGYDTGYYPYTLTVYDDPTGYDVTYGPLTLGGVGIDAGQQGGDAGTTGVDVPELLAKARRAANAVNAGIRTTLDPIKDILKTPPVLGDSSVTYGPMDRGTATYRFIVRRLSGTRHYGWTLEGRRAGSDAAFVLVAGGNEQVGDTPRRGRGVLGADYDAQSSIDTAVLAKGKLLLGFASDTTTKTLRYALDGYTPDPALLDPLDATMIGWHELDTASRTRIVARTNLAETETDAPELVVIKTRWIKGTGARADAIAVGGDIPSGSSLHESACVPRSLDRKDESTSAKLCTSAGEDCTPEVTCPNGLTTAEEPQEDPKADDPPADIPEAPEAPSTVPSGTEG